MCRLPIQKIIKLIKKILFYQHKIRSCLQKSAYKGQFLLNVVNRNRLRDVFEENTEN